MDSHATATTLCLIVVFAIAAIRLFKSWNSQKTVSRVFRIIVIIFLLMSYTLFFLRLHAGQTAYRATGGEFTYQLPQGKYTFYIHEYEAWFIKCCRVWVHKDGSAFVYPVAETHCRCDLLGEPEVEGNHVRFYFHDQHFLNAADQYLQFDALTETGTYYNSYDN
jgi:hypothetical protein